VLIVPGYAGAAHAHDLSAVFVKAGGKLMIRQVIRDFGPTIVYCTHQGDLHSNTKQSSEIHLLRLDPQTNTESRESSVTKRYRRPTGRRLCLEMLFRVFVDISTTLARQTAGLPMLQEPGEAVPPPKISSGYRCIGSISRCHCGTLCG
jgi:hypothetical protein